MRIYLISFFIITLYSFCWASSSDANDVLHSFILEFHNDTSKPVTILEVNPPALIKKHDVIEAHQSTHMLLLPHTTVKILFDNHIYEIHIRTKEKHPASLTFRHSHRSYPVVETKNIKVSIRNPNLKHRNRMT